MEFIDNHSAGGEALRLCLCVCVHVPPICFVSSMPRIKFTVSGKVQGVWFRACTQEKAKTLNLTGWVVNTLAGTVRGEAQGDTEALGKLKHWLEYEGSPLSKVSKAEFSDIPEETCATECEEFVVKRGRY